MLSLPSLLLRPSPKAILNCFSPISPLPLLPPQPPHSLSSLCPLPTLAPLPLGRHSSLTTTTTTTTCIDAFAATTTTRTDPPNISLSNHNHLKIAIIGFGNYGQFLARTFTSQGHTVLAHSRSGHSHAAASLGISFFKDPNDLCEQHPEVIILSTSIISTENVLKSLPLQRLKRNTLFVDVLSVKEFAKNILLEMLPLHFDIICAHPMFGPQSARKHGWRNFNFVFENVRIGKEECRIDRRERFLDIFRREGCRMVEMSCQDHDKHAAGSQFVTHTVGRVLGMLSLESTPINTKGYESLLELAENTEGESFDLYYGLFNYNKSALEMLERFDLAFEALRMQLSGRLHEVVSKQLFRNGNRGKSANGQQVNGAVLGGDVSKAQALR